MKQLKINPEFEKLCRRLSTDEFDRLEKNIIENGCLDPIQLWNGFIVDGHNRNFICNKHNIEFRTVSLAFDSEDDVMLHIINNQLGRRNLSDLDKAALLARKEPILRSQAKERMKIRKGNQAGASQVNLPDLEKGQVRDQLAKELGVSKMTYSNLKTINKEGTEDLKQAVRDRKIAAYKAVKIAKLPKEEQPEQVKSMIEQKEKRKEKKPDEEKPKKVILTKEELNNIPETAWQCVGAAKVQIEKIQKGDKSAIKEINNFITWLENFKETLQ